MDVAEPGRGLSSGLTMPILRTLASRSSPVTAAQLCRLGDVGTEAGVRRAAERLALHGVCLSDEVGGRVVYSLNYDHVLWRAIDELLKADKELHRRLKRALSEWEPSPVSAVLFGSAARRDGDADSDIDVLLVHPVMTDAARRAWARQVHELRNSVDRWTGNRLQVLDWSRLQLRRNARSREDLVDTLLDEGLLLHGARLSDLLEGKA